MELVVYMAMIGIVVLVAGQAFSDSTKFRVRTQNMLKASVEAENVAMLFKDDIAQMGAKSSKETTIAGADDEFSESHKDDIYIDVGNADKTKEDSSSFRLVFNPTGENLDSLIFRKIRYTEEGKFAAVEEVRWFLDNQDLKRSCAIVSKAAGEDDEPCASSGAGLSDMEAVAVTMATNVRKFRLLPAIPAIRSDASKISDQTEQMFPMAGLDAFKMVSRYGESYYNFLSATNTASNAVILSGFSSNYDMSAQTPIEDGKQVNQVFAFQKTDNSGTWATLCALDYNSFSFYKGFEYEIYFEIPYPTNSEDKARLFVPGRDHMAVGFRDMEGNRPAQIDDFLFYPPTTIRSGSVPRRMRFSVKDSVKNVCLAFTFASYSPDAHNGTITIENLKLSQIASSHYEFDEDKIEVKPQDKQNVKAFKLLLTIKRGGKTANDAGETGEISLVIPTPSNGPDD